MMSRPAYWESPPQPPGAAPLPSHVINRSQRQLRSLCAHVCRTCACSAHDVVAGRGPTAMSTSPTPCISLAGGRGFDVGRRHGLALAKQIAAVLKPWRRHLQRALAGASYDYNTSDTSQRDDNGVRANAQATEEWITRFASKVRVAMQRGAMAGSAASDVARTHGI